MGVDHPHHHRRSIRLQGYDYAGPGGYFVTLCTHNRVCLFGEITGDNMQLNDIGRIVVEELTKTPDIRREIRLDAFVVMPNHVHAIVWIVADNGDPNPTGNADHPAATDTRIPIRRGDRPVAPSTDTVVYPNDTSIQTDNRTDVDHPVNMVAPIRRGDRPVAPTGPPTKSLGAMIAGFKSAATTRINQFRGTPGAPVWQRNYYEHIIRHADSLARIRWYIEHNPAHWNDDTDNPSARVGSRTGVKP